MNSPGGRSLKSTSLPGDGATRIRHILLLSLVGLFLFCGCNKTPPAENSASSAPPAAPAAAPAPDQAAPQAASAPCQAAQHLRSESPRISVQKRVTSATPSVERSRNLSVSRE